MILGYPAVGLLEVKLCTQRASRGGNARANEPSGDRDVVFPEFVVGVLLDRTVQCLIEDTDAAGGGGTFGRCGTEVVHGSEARVRGGWVFVVHTELAIKPVVPVVAVFLERTRTVNVKDPDLDLNPIGKVSASVFFL